MGMSSAQMSQGSSAAGGIAGAFSSIADAVHGAKLASAARKSMKIQAKFMEETAQVEADALLKAADDRFGAFHRRATELRGEAADITEIGEDQAHEMRQEGASLVSTIRAQAAAHGIKQTGSPLEFAAKAIEVAEYQAFQIERNASIEADARLFEASQLTEAGGQDLAASRFEAEVTILNATNQAAFLRSGAPGRFEGLMMAGKALGGFNRKKVGLILEDTKSFVGSFGSKKQSSSLNPYGSPRGSDL